MEAAAGFPASNRSREHLSRFFLTVVVMVGRGVNLLGRNFLLAEFGNVFACSARTSSPMDNPRLPLDSARQIGLGSTPHEFSDCSGDVSRGGEV